MNNRMRSHFLKRTVLFSTEPDPDVLSGEASGQGRDAEKPPRPQLPVRDQGLQQIGQNDHLQVDFGLKSWLTFVSET